MKIKEITSQNRRDFRAIYVCEHCDAEVTKSGYDDEHFHTHVIPNMACDSCGKTAGDNYRPLTTKYPAHQVV